MRNIKLTTLHLLGFIGCILGDINCGDRYPQYSQTSNDFPVLHLRERGIFAGRFRESGCQAVGSGVAGPVS